MRLGTDRAIAGAALSKLSPEDLQLRRCAGALEKPEIARGLRERQTKIVTHSLQVDTKRSGCRLVPIDVVYLLVHEPSAKLL